MKYYYRDTENSSTLVTSDSPNGRYSVALDIDPSTRWSQGSQTEEQLSHWNSGRVVFLHCDHFQEICDVRALKQKLSFISSIDGKRTKPLYTYPIYECALNCWNTHNIGHWQVITPNPKSFIYVLSRSQVVDFVEHGSDELPAFQLWKDEAIKLYDRDRNNYFLSLFDDSFSEPDCYLDFNMKYEVIISEVPIARVEKA